MSDALARLYAATRAFALATPEVNAFRGLPQDPPRLNKPHTPVPALPHLTAHFPTKMASERGKVMAHAVIDAADQIDWLLTYTEDLVGADFLARYGWFELLGPTGHFMSDDVVAFVGYWGQGLRYPWHWHEAEEIYVVVDGACLFEAEGREARAASPGDTSHHVPWQAHALRTQDQPVLALAIQMGHGLNDVPEILPERGPRAHS